MNKQEIETIREECKNAMGPGKFEGEPIYASYLYDKVLDGAADESFYFGEGEPCYDMIIITAEDREIFPELDCYGVACWESDQGFFNMVELDTAADYDAERKNLAFQEQESAEGGEE